MTNALKIGQTITIDSFPVQIIAIAAKHDIQDFYVILGKSDILGHLISECDIEGKHYVYTTFFANAEEAYISYVDRAFGINV